MPETAASTTDSLAQRLIAGDKRALVPPDEMSKRAAEAASTG